MHRPITLAVSAVILIALPAVAQKKPATKKAVTKPAATDTKRDADVAAASAKIDDMLDMLHEKLLAYTYDAPLTAELLSVSRTSGGKMTEDPANTRSIYVSDEISIGWIVAAKQVSFFLENRTSRTMRLVWDQAVLVDGDGKNHRVIHAGVRMIDSDKPQSPSTILGGTKLEDMVFPADLLSFQDGSWQREPIFKALDVGDKLLIMLPFDVAGQISEYTFTFRVRAVDPEGLRERERTDIVAKVGDAATVEKIIEVLKRQPDKREDRDTSFGKFTRLTYTRERLSFDLLDGKLDSVATVGE